MLDYSTVSIIIPLYICSVVSETLGLHAQI